MSRRPRAVLASIALAGVAFAPVTPSTGETVIDVDGVEIHVTTDEDPTTEQPVVLEFVRTQNEVGDAERWLRHDLAHGYVVLGNRCGDLGGPADQQVVVDVLAAVSGLDGLDGHIAAFGQYEAGSVLLAGAATEAGSALLDAVATHSATVDPHHVRFSDGNVARRSLDVSYPPDECEEPFDLSEPARTDDWADRDVRARAQHLAGLHLALRHDANADSLPGPTIDLWQALQETDSDGRGRELHVSNGTYVADFGDWTQGDQALDRLLKHALDVEDEWRYSRGAIVSMSHAWDDQDVPYGNANHTTSVASLDLFDDVEVLDLHLNRTFEQDLDCVPVCVPGPGTGEDGSLELDNKYTPPHAPVFTWADAGVNSESVTNDDPLNDGTGIGGEESLPGGHGYHSLAFATDPIPDTAQVVGRVELDGWFNTGSAGGTVTPILMIVLDNGVTGVVARGALDLDFHADPATRQHVAGWKRGTIRFDHTMVRLREGDRLAVVLQSHNIDHFVPGTPQGTVNVATGPVDGVTDVGSVLRVPFDTGPLLGDPFGGD